MTQCDLAGLGRPMLHSRGWPDLHSLAIHLTCRWGGWGTPAQQQHPPSLLPGPRESLHTTAGHEEVSGLHRERAGGGTAFPQPRCAYGPSPQQGWGLPPASCSFPFTPNVATTEPVPFTVPTPASSSLADLWPCLLISESADSIFWVEALNT